MRTLTSKNGNVGYGYDKGEVASFDEYVQRLSAYGLPEDYLYDTLYELPEITNGIDYDAFDEERVERLGYPKDWLRRCGLNPGNMPNLPDEVVIEICETLKSIDENMSGYKIDFSRSK
jgi:hypothetical protein